MIYRPTVDTQLADTTAARAISQFSSMKHSKATNAQKHQSFAEEFPSLLGLRIVHNKAGEAQSSLSKNSCPQLELVPSRRPLESALVSQ